MFVIIILIISCFLTVNLIQIALKKYLEIYAKTRVQMYNIYMYKITICI
jgi:hypothetical protein